MHVTIVPKGRSRGDRRSRWRFNCKIPAQLDQGLLLLGAPQRYCVDFTNFDGQPITVMPEGGTVRIPDTLLEQLLTTCRPLYAWIVGLTPDGHRSPPSRELVFYPAPHRDDPEV